jgi:hypothetical protein
MLTMPDQYQVIFNAIAAAVKREANGIAISVEAFRKAIASPQAFGDLTALRLARNDAQQMGEDCRWSVSSVLIKAVDAILRSHTAPEEKREEPTVLKGPLPGQVVEEYRRTHGGKLPGEQ